MVLIYPAEFSRHENDPVASANAICTALYEHARALDVGRSSKLLNVLTVILEDRSDQDLGQRLLNQIMGVEKFTTKAVKDLAKADRFHAICAGYAHDAIIATQLASSNPWALIAHSMYWLSVAASDDSYEEIVKSFMRSDARRRANKAHDKPGGSRDKRRRIAEIWASGKYDNRDLCAEQECAALGMSFSTARKALRGLPKPLPATGKG
jgi:hypothetical protein